MLLLLLACTGEPLQDTAAPEAVEEVPTGDPCEVLEIHVNGDDPPQVGDEWTVWLWCDDALMTGAMRLSFDPPDIATVSENNAQFLYAGDAMVTIQVGSRRQTREVNVSPAR
ncbi:MAG: hypothetical protein Q8P18_29060 [Pseudomonadota bacterium]|nr:hypothetical protein [Pseudomonadota bacterium]